MTKTEALRILIASKDDPVLASWATVAHEHKSVGSTDVSPYEYWEAFQRLYDYGLITPDQFNGIDARQVFFSGRRIPADAIQHVLSNLKLLPERHEQESTMSQSHTKLGNPFGNDQALVTREPAALNGRHGHGPALPARQHAHEIGVPFSPSSEALPPSKRNLEIEPFPQPSLPCRDNNAMNMGHFRLTCMCGDPVAMDVDDMIGGEGPDDSIPGGQVVVLSRVMHGQCRRCGKTWHTSVNEIDINDVDR